MYMELYYPAGSACFCKTHLKKKKTMWCLLQWNILFLFNQICDVWMDFFNAYSAITTFAIHSFILRVDFKLCHISQSVVCLLVNNRWYFPLYTRPCCSPTRFNVNIRMWCILHMWQIYYHTWGEIVVNVVIFADSAISLKLTLSVVMHGWSSWQLKWFSDN